MLVLQGWYKEGQYDWSDECLQYAAIALHLLAQPQNLQRAETLDQTDVKLPKETASEELGSCKQ